MPMRINSVIPPLDGATDWLGGKPVQTSELVGSPTLIHFWSVSCPSCKETLPNVNRWRNELVPQGLKLVSIHVPLSEGDTNINTIQDVAKQYGLTHTIAVDNNGQISDSFENEYVPAFYVFDRSGKLRFRAAGHSGIAMVEDRLSKVMARDMATV